MKDIRTRTVIALAAIALDLPRPDGKPGDNKKPVKVYILHNDWMSVTNR